jgi:hypothetical protein
VKRTALSVAAACALFTLACGSSKSSATGPGADASTDAKGPNGDASTQGDATSEAGGVSDSGVTESGSETEGAAPGSFPCGSLSCNDNTQFCFEEGSGAAIDGGNMTYACLAIPTQCLVNPTCQCIEEADAGADGCPCTIENGGFVLDCLHP